ncbi:tRNA pseudouridine(55) synthase TruB [Haliscomenobacter hydrossis]|uniref:tRNA pseudouridine synthase B n=1 Tax=Haliscomenobacter hydrossis (strain ATCC 27775 / DSM 1100 / LMG 10767 / O) TaxID=760192 RepID=F4L6F0_HALH1|nr:tRNA pseudouridine(55) synthase TruB [Haliscomenobacter hydrossis]AEE48832.1 tRNA pseudouridine synthase B [Haliscomenobacter hydrossis DSM 1100]
MDPNAGERPLTSQFFTEGAVLLVDKPQGWTSFDVVNKIRGKIRSLFQLKNIKVGHAGTLDPMATGLLIVCTGKDTKRINEYQDRPKEYTGTITFGATTPSYDAETEIDASYPTEHITPELLENARQKFLGEIEQVPPMFSAIKVDGQPLYKMARKGESIKVEARKVHIYTMEFTRIELPEVDFRVECSKGTYIRSLAFDLGKAVKSGAYLSALRRTKIGEFEVDKAKSVSEWVEWME